MKKFKISAIVLTFALSTTFLTRCSSDYYAENPRSTGNSGTANDTGSSFDNNFGALNNFGVLHNQGCEYMMPYIDNTEMGQGFNNIQKAQLESQFDAFCDQDNKTDELVGHNQLDSTMLSLLKGEPVDSFNNHLTRQINKVVIALPGFANQMLVADTARQFFGSIKLLPHDVQAPMIHNYARTNLDRIYNSTNRYDETDRSKMVFFKIMEYSNAHWRKDQELRDAFKPTIGYPLAFVVQADCIGYLVGWSLALKEDYDRGAATPENAPRRIQRGFGTGLKYSSVTRGVGMKPWF
jgi:hypothetical protein